ncbi:hypothetical protein Tco_1018137 [Tanacetum coccineum]|uniref:Uncharacterized protein n=1 Tax=Tanacetum coccineum TaxID=301880 RepID=A0ABQ5FVG3_9ASTR
MQDEETEKDSSGQSKALAYGTHKRNAYSWMQRLKLFWQMWSVQHLMLNHWPSLPLKFTQLVGLPVRGDIVINPLHTPHRVHDNEDTLVHAKVSRTKMLEKMKDPECPIISSPINYAKLNNLYDTFVPQKELTREHAYWLPANEVASNQSKPAQQFVHTHPAKSQVNSHLKTLKSCFLEFDEVIKFRTKPTCLTDGEWRFEHTKRCFVEQIIPFYEKLKTHVKGIEDNLFKEVSEYMKILMNWTKSMINV